MVIMKLKRVRGRVRSSSFVEAVSRHHVSFRRTAAVVCWSAD
jgi:hypothetical protein